MDDKVDPRTTSVNKDRFDVSGHSVFSKLGTCDIQGNDPVVVGVGSAGPTIVNVPEVGAMTVESPSPLSSQRLAPLAIRKHAFSDGSVQKQIALKRELLNQQLCIAEKAIVEENVAALLFLKDQVDRLFKELYSMYENVLSTCDGNDNVTLQRELAGLRISQGEFEIRLRDLHMNKADLTSRGNSFVNPTVSLRVSKAQSVASRSTPSHASSRNRGSRSSSASRSSRSSSIYSNKERKLQSTLKLEKAKLRLKCLEEELSLERQCRKMEAKRELAEAELEARIVCEDSIIANCKSSAGQDPNITSTSAPIASAVTCPPIHNVSVTQAVNPPDKDQVSAFTPCSAHAFKEQPHEKRGCPPQHPSSTGYYLSPSMPSGAHFSPQNDSQFVSAIVRAMTEAMTAPKLECTKFYGDPMNYTAFIRCFNENVDKKELSAMQKLTLLTQATGGKAKRSIDHCPNIWPCEKGYLIALDTLYKRYGRPSVIATAFKQNLFNTPCVRPNDRESLSDYATSLRKCFEILQSMGNVAEMNNSLVTLAEKLPFKVKEAWNRRYAEISCRKSKLPDFSDFVQYVEEEANLLNAYPEQSFAINRQNDKKHVFKSSNASKSTCANVVSGVQSPSFSSKRKPDSILVSNVSCFYCSKSHVIAKCESFVALPLKQRKEFLNKQLRCFNCFLKHCTNDCRRPSTCKAKECKEKHHSLMHDHTLDDVDLPTVQSNFTNNSENSTANCNVVRQKQRCYFNVVPAKVCANGNEIFANVFLDPGSDTSFCRESLIETLHLSGEQKQLSLSTLGKRPTIYNSVSVNLSVVSLDGSAKFNLPQVIAIDKIPVNVNPSLSGTDIQTYPHLKDLLLPVIKNTDVSLLIGNDIIQAHSILEERNGNGIGPNAWKTPLGWSLVGPSLGFGTRDAHVNFLKSDELLDSDIQRSWLKEFKPEEIPFPTSKQDREVLTLLHENVTYTNGHFYAPLPWRHDVSLPKHSRLMADRRLYSLKKRLERDEVLKNKYVAKMQKYIDNNHVEIVTDQEKLIEGKVWYLPHHPVYHPRKPDKVRIVFDCAARHKGISLNDALLQGPDLVNSLVGVLTRFRRKRIAVIADVESMFHQVRVKKEDQDALRFLWWPGGDLAQTPVSHQMLVHVFGATSSPYCAGFCLAQTVKQFGVKFNSATSEVIKNDFYVDNCLTSCDSTDEAITLVKQLRELIKIGGAAVRREINTCVFCRKRSVPGGRQLMSILPSGCLKANNPPVSYTGVDYFGAYYVKRARSLEKRYGYVFSCLTMRAVHIEVAPDLSADSFINTFRRFVSRRGKPKEVYSGNGSNFVGAEKILKESLRELNQQVLQSFFCQEEIKWNFNPPTANHMGGAWERMIRSIRRIFCALLQQQTLTDDVLHTLLVKVEKILNSRPLVPINIDPSADEVLTPNHLLLLRSEDNLPPGIFDKKDNYVRRRWRQTQYLANQFWKRWSRVYIPAIALRQKWPDVERNLKIGDIVLVIENNAPRRKWRLGRVVEQFPDRQGIVRTVEIQTQYGRIRRPISGWCLILKSDDINSSFLPSINSDRDEEPNNKL